MAHPESTRTMVTGAGRGLGLEFVRQCLDRGDRVYAGVRNPDAADELRELSEARPGRLFIFPLDVSDPDSIRAARAAVEEQTEHLDVLINNAGINSRSGGIPEEQRNVTLGTLEPEGLLNMMRVNAVGPILVAQEFLGLLAKRKHARIINISSWLGSIERKRSGGNYGYCASKAALNMLGRTLAFDLEERGIIVLLFNPGWVKTDMGGERAEFTPTQSVCRMLSTSDTATLEDTGSFFQGDGTIHPW